MSNFVYIATSLDGYISSPDKSLGWLDYVPAPEGDDLGFSEYLDFHKRNVASRGSKLPDGTPEAPDQRSSHY